jgi:hypothetical protein
MFLVDLVPEDYQIVMYTSDKIRPEQSKFTRTQPPFLFGGHLFDVQFVFPLISSQCYLLTAYLDIARFLDTQLEAKWLLAGGGKQTQRTNPGHSLIHYPRVHSQKKVTTMSS